MILVTPTPSPIMFLVQQPHAGLWWASILYNYCPLKGCCPLALLLSVAALEEIDNMILGPCSPLCTGIDFQLLSPPPPPPPFVCMCMC